MVHGFRSESYFCKTLIKRSFKSCPPRLPRSLLAPFCRVYSLTLFNCLASAERPQWDELFSEVAFLFSCNFVFMKKFSKFQHILYFLVWLLDQFLLKIKFHKNKPPERIPTHCVEAFVWYSIPLVLLGSAALSGQYFKGSGFKWHFGALFYGPLYGCWKGYKGLVTARTRGTYYSSSSSCCRALRSKFPNIGIKWQGNFAF